MEASALMNTSSKKFLTLLQREWMQHRWGWTILALAPTAVVLLAMIVAMVTPNAEGGVKVQMDGGEAGAFVLPLVLMVGTLGLAALSAAFQAPSLARRDVQDRSIEFWLSQPVGHAPSVGATLLAHHLLWPLAAAVVGFVGGVALLPIVAAAEGMSEVLGEVPWAAAAWASVAVLLRTLWGVLLAVLWLSPLVLMVMAASAWLKRWGLPALAGGFAALALLEKRYFASEWVVTALRYPLDRAVSSFGSPERVAALANSVSGPGDLPALLSALPGEALRDAVQALGSLMHWSFLPTVGVAIACFMALVLRRQRGG
jgi:ABC-2 type transport system permease protein